MPVNAEMIANAAQLSQKPPRLVDALTVENQNAIALIANADQAAPAMEKQRNHVVQEKHAHAALLMANAHVAPIANVTQANARIALTDEYR